MDYNYHVPGYSGHQPSFAKDYVARPTVPAYRYHYVPPATVKLTDDTRFKSVNAAQTGPETTILRKTELKLPEVPADANARTQGFRTTAKEQRERETKEAYEHQSTAHWGTSYKSSFDPSVHTALHEAKKKMASSGTTVRHIDAYGTATSLPANSLRSTQQTSNYVQDFGSFGANPLDRSAESVKEFSKTSTSSDLFAGTTRGSVRIPGYSGHVPSHDRNRSHLDGGARVNLKDNLVQTYRGTKPGFTGYQPKSVFNAPSIRKDRAMSHTAQTKQVFAASLIVDSMRKQK